MWSSGRINADASKKGQPKPKNADGTWRQKRGLNDPALKARVAADQKAAAEERARLEAVIRDLASNTRAAERGNQQSPEARRKAIFNKFLRGGLRLLDIVLNEHLALQQRSTVNKGHHDKAKDHESMGKPSAQVDFH